MIPILIYELSYLFYSGSSNVSINSFVSEFQIITILVLVTNLLVTSLDLNFQSYDY